MIPDPPLTTPLPAERLDTAKMPGHWLLARMGKRVLRPGGLELTGLLLDSLKIESDDTVVEMAPGLGATARITLQKQPAHYVGVERDEAAANRVRSILRGDQDSCVLGSAAETGLEAGSADVVYGEAMLSMQTASQKSIIAREAFRILKPGGLYGIHELGLKPDTMEGSKKEEILAALSSAIRVGARPLTASEWMQLLKDEGFEVDPSGLHVAQMHLLEPRRIIADEGLLGAVRIALNVIRNPAARRRILRMREVFRLYEESLCAIALVAHKPN